MKSLIITAFGCLLIAACNSSGSNTKTTDSTTIPTTETNKADGGPNNGLGDTNSLNGMNDTISHDTLNKK
jgi:hypothetical protein